LREGAVLKKRFDDIFDSTRYVKALEELKDQKKKYVAKVKDHKTELAKLEAHKHAAVGLRMDLDTCRQGLSDISDEVEEYNKLIAIEQEKARECNKIIEKDIDVHDAIEEKKNLMSQEEARAETLRASLSEDLSHKSKEDLEGMVSGFEQNVDTDRENLAAIEKEINQIENNIRHLQNKEKERMGERGSLLAEKKIYEENCVKRLELMEELATKYGLDLSISQSQQVDLMSTQINRFGDDSTIGDSTLGSSVSVTITSEDIAAFEESIRRKKKEIEEQLMSYRDASRIGEDEIQARLSEVYGKIKSIEIGTYKSVSFLVNIFLVADISSFVITT
jgi:DNA repair protein RAD50